MPAEPIAASAGPPEKLSVVVLSAEFTRVHYALVLASAAAAVGTPATLFFTHGALRALVADDPDGGPGWQHLPGVTGMQTQRDPHVRGREIDALWQHRGIGGFEELLSACAELGVRFIACEMGLRALGIDATALRRDIPIEVAGVVTMLTDARATGAMVTL